MATNPDAKWDPNLIPASWLKPPQFFGTGVQAPPRAPTDQELHGKPAPKDRNPLGKKKKPPPAVQQDKSGINPLLSVAHHAMGLLDHLPGLLGGGSGKLINDLAGSLGGTEYKSENPGKPLRPGPAGRKPGATGRKGQSTNRGGSWIGYVFPKFGGSGVAPHGGRTGPWTPYPKTKEPREGLGNEAMVGGGSNGNAIGPEQLYSQVPPSRNPRFPRLPGTPIGGTGKTGWEGGPGGVSTRGPQGTDAEKRPRPRGDWGKPTRAGKPSAGSSGPDPHRDPRNKSVIDPMVAALAKILGFS